MSDFTARSIDDMETFHGGLFRKARAEVGASAFGLAVIELEPNAENYPHHDHSEQEEVYVVLTGEGVMSIDGDEVDLMPGVVVRVGPSAKRVILPGSEGMRVLCVGGVPGEAYEAPEHTELGAPDPR